MSHDLKGLNKQEEESHLIRKIVEKVEHKSCVKKEHRSLMADRYFLVFFVFVFFALNKNNYSEKETERQRAENKGKKRE